MKLQIKARPVTDWLISAVVIPTGLVFLVGCCGLLLKWNLATASLFWFMAVPLVIFFLSAKFFRERNAAWRSLISVLTFYGFMVFMIYKHYQSDFFVLMMMSFVWNLLVLLLVITVNRMKV